MPNAARLPLRFLRGQYGRLVLTIVALAAGVGLIAATDLVNRAVYVAFADVVDTMAGRAALQVTAGEGGLFPEDTAAIVQSVPGVDLAVPVVGATAFIGDGQGEMLTVHGIDVTNDDAVRTYRAHDPDGDEIDDPLVFLSQPNSILATRQLATRRSIAIGDSLELETPRGRRDFIVRGLIDAQGIGAVFGGNLVVMDIMAAEQAFTQPGLINRIDVVVRPDHRPEAVADALRAALPIGLEIAAPGHRKVDLQRVMESVQVLLAGVSLLSLFAAFLIIFNRLSAVFESRLWQVGIMRAMGVRPARVVRELLAEAALIGVAGVVGGVLLGLGLARLILPVIAEATAIGAKLTVPSAQLELRPRSLAMASVLGLAATLLAALLPAWRTAHVDVSGLLRARGREIPPDDHNRLRLVRWLVTGFAVAAVTAEVASGSASAGLAASLLVLIAAAFMARPVVEATRRPAIKAALWHLGPTGRLAAAALERNPRRTSLTVATLGVGFAVVTWLWVLAGSVERSIVRVMPGIFRADLVVGSIRLGTGYVEAPMDESVVAQLLDTEGVEAAVGEQVSDWRFRGGPIAINAFDAQFFTDPGFERWPMVGTPAAGLWQELAAGRMAVVSSNFARNLGMGIGDVLELETPSGQLAVRIGGITHDFLSPRGSVLMSRELYRRRWHDTHVTHVLLKTREGADSSAIRSLIARDLGTRYSLRILSVGELVDWFASQARRAFSAVYALGVMVLLVVALGVADTVAAGVLERQRELAAMRAFGVRRHSIGRMILTEALLLAVQGVAIAMSAGLVLGVLWVRVTFQDLVGWVLELHVPGGYFALTTLLAIGICVAAAAMSAYRATRLHPAEALRYE